MQDPFFTSDQHIGHHNLLRHRPQFRDVAHMNRVIVERWNDCVGPDDEVYVLGDVSFASLSATTDVLDAMNGRKYLVAGNHDKGMRKRAEFQKRFEWIKDYHELVVQDETHPRGKQEIMLMHFPILSWNKSRYGAFMLHGHSHNSPAMQRLNADVCRMDVGVDTNDFRPYRYSQIKELMALKADKAYDP